MKNQYCKVGAVTSMTIDTNELDLLKRQYQNFMDKASNFRCSDTRLAEFFELKAMKIDEILKGKMQ